MSVEKSVAREVGLEGAQSEPANPRDRGFVSALRVSAIVDPVVERWCQPRTWDWRQWSREEWRVHVQHLMLNREVSELKKLVWSNEHPYLSALYEVAKFVHEFALRNFKQIAIGLIGLGLVAMIVKK